MAQRSSFILIFALFLASPWAQAQNPDEALPIQRAPGVEKLPEDQRVVVTLRTWGGIWEPIQFEVLPLNAPPNAEPIMRGITDREGLARVELPSSEVSDWEDARGIHVRVAQPGFQSKRGGQRLSCNSWTKPGNRPQPA